MLPFYSEPMTTAPALHIGSAAGFSGDRPDAAGPVVDELIRLGGPAALVFETLAERTLALAQLARRNDPSTGYEPLLQDMLAPVLARCLAHGIRIVGNFGAANPTGAARHIARLARELGLRQPHIAVISGDDLSGPEHRDLLQQTFGNQLDGLRIVSANAYIGAESIAQALRAGANIVVAGRIADPALALGPALAHFGWRMDDWDRLAGATMAGHLLECGAQVTGGYYADPGIKTVPGMARLGYPVARLEADGSCVISKPEGTGGLIDRHVVTEQLLYEVHDPAAYLTPDVVTDISQARLDEIGPDQVRLSGVLGHPCTPTLKVNVCHENGWLAEGEISYAGPRAEARARLAAEVVRERMGADLSIRTDLIGVLSVLADDSGTALAAQPLSAAQDVRLRLALRHADRTVAQRLLREVTALYTCGPAGGGGVRTHLRPTLGTVSGLVPRDRVITRFHMLEDGHA